MPRRHLRIGSTLRDVEGDELFGFEYGELWESFEGADPNGTRFHGVLRHVSDDHEVWRCAHDHKSTHDALQCAERQLSPLRGENMG
jgi:hypothetical protein